MAFTLTPLAVKDGAEADKDIIAFANDDGELAAAHPLLDNTGAIINPATADKQPTLDNGKAPVVPAMTSGGHLSAQTANPGTNWTTLSLAPCKQLTVSNQTGTTLEFRQGGAGAGFQVPTGAFYTFFGITNANQLEVRRVDQANTQVTVTARWES
jgi:hypothetical protein